MSKQESRMLRMLEMLVWRVSHCLLRRILKAGLFLFPKGFVVHQLSMTMHSLVTPCPWVK